MWKTATVLISIVLILMTVGIVMLASTSGVRAMSEAHHNPHFYVTRQLVWLALGLGLGVLASKFDYHNCRWLAIPLGLFCVALLIMVLIPGVGQTINGASRWLRVGSINFQPSELAKFSVVLFIAWWMKRVQRKVDRFVPGFVIPMFCLGLMLGLIFIEPDFGTTMLIATVGLSMMFLGGTRLSYLFVSTVLGLVGFAVAVMHDKERMGRIFAFMNPEEYAEDEAFQLMNALYAFVVGGPRGAGLGNSLQKLFYLPEAHTDFIYAIVGEELGLTASLGVLLLFLGIFACGMVITVRAKDMMGRLLAFGMTLMITFQAMINIGVVTGCLPTKGLALPFISYGGSSLLISCAMVGVMVNVALHASGAIQDEDTVAIKDRIRRL